MNDSTRREFLIGIGCLTAGATVPAPAVATRDRPDELAEFYVEGTEVQTVEYRPETVSITKRKYSEDLADRPAIDGEAVESGVELDRSRLEPDPLPESGTDRFELDWNTYVATDEQWERLFSGDATTTDGPTAGEDDHPDVGLWTYEANDDETVFDASGPVDVVCELDLAEVSAAFDDAGWYADLIEYERFAWHTADQTFYSHESAHGRSRGTDTTGDRFHVRYWDLSSDDATVVSLQAHEDETTFTGHEVGSYRTAMQKVAQDVFAPRGYRVTEDARNLGNATSDPPYDGVATEIAAPPGPAIDAFAASGKKKGSWLRVNVDWAVSDADGDLATVTATLLDADGQSLDRATTDVAGSAANGSSDLRSKTGGDSVRLVVTDAFGNETTDTTNV